MRRSRLPALSCCIGFARISLRSVDCAFVARRHQRSGTPCSPPEGLHLVKTSQVRRIQICNKTSPYAFAHEGCGSLAEKVLSCWLMEPCFGKADLHYPGIVANRE